MSNRFINRKLESEYITHLIEQKNRINIIFSNKGLGKTSLLEHLLKQINSDMYVRVNTDELLDNSAPEFYFITKVIHAINENLCFKSSVNYKINNFFNKYKSNLSVSVNMGFIGIGCTLPQDHKVSINKLIENIKLFNNNIYIHIEDIQRIDFSSLNYIIRIVNETDNVLFFLECSDNADLCDKIKEILSKNMMNVDILSIKKLDWTHVSLILKDLNIIVTNSLKQEYETLNGNIKELIFNNKYRISKNISLDAEQQFILNFIQLVGTQISLNEIHKILINYDIANKYLFSFTNIRTYLKELLSLELISEMNFDYYYVTDIGTTYTTNDKVDLFLSMLSDYYIPRFTNNNIIQDDMIKGLRLLINVYLKYNDIRITKIIPYIEPSLLLLNGDKNTLDKIYHCLGNIFTPDLYSSMLLVAKSYIKINCFEEAKEIFDRYITEENSLSIILYATILIHIEPDKKSTERYIINHIVQTSDFTLTSALYTCLVSLYMQVKSTSYVLSYIENLDKAKLTETDYYIIQKNSSIYLDTDIAITKLNNCYDFFEKNHNNRLCIATAVTLATKYAQAGNISNAKKLLEELCDNQYLSMQDLIYIENNLSIFNILESKINKKIIHKLKEAYSFCKDTYTHLLISNNILIYYLQTNELSKASLYAEEIEKEGFNIYNFDDYLHLTYLNLRYYYTKLKDFDKINYYNSKLTELKDICYSEELKEYINAGLTGTNILNKHNRWFYMASYQYRPAFVGHWIINDFDC